MTTGKKTVESGYQLPTVDDATMARINEFALTPLRPADVAVIQAEASDDQVDRDGEAMSLEVLEDFASTAAGKSWLIAHEWSVPGVGRITQGWLEEEEGGRVVLMVEAYLLRQDPTAAELVRKIESGVAPFVSIGFYAPRRVTKLLDDGRQIQQYVRGADGEPGELIEVSSVFLGSNYGAVITSAKAAGRKHAGCGRDELTCAIEADVLRKELWATKELIDRARYDRPGLPRRTDLPLVELDQKRVELTERLAASCRGGL
jgi:hypothetical protein